MRSIDIGVFLLERISFINDSGTEILVKALPDFRIVNHSLEEYELELIMFIFIKTRLQDSL